VPELSRSALLLPSNSTRLDRAIAHAVRERFDTLESSLEEILDPLRTPERFLPWLAWAKSIDIYREEWPLDKRRSVVNSWFALHRLKGTEEGLRRHIALEDSILVKTVSPPAKGFRRPAMTEKERTGWVDQLPQIRLFPYRAPIVYEESRGYHAEGEYFRTNGFRRPSLGISLLEMRGAVVIDGVTRDVRVEQIDQLGAQAVLRVFFTTEVDLRSFRSASFRQQGFRQPTQAQLGVITVRLGPNGQHMATEGLRPVDVRPTRVHEKHIQLPSYHFHSHGFRGHNFRQTSNAYEFIYERFALYDHSRLPSGLSARWFRGHKRYGIAPYTAELTIEVPMRRSRGRGFGDFRNGYRVPTDMTKLNRTLEAVVISKSLRDKILVDTTVHKRATLKDALKLGTFKLGEIRRMV